MSPNYSKSAIYILECINKLITEIYVGKTLSRK